MSESFQPGELSLALAKELERGTKLWKEQKTEEALSVLSAAEVRSRSEGTNAQRVLALCHLARTYSMLKRLDEGQPFLDQAASLSREDQPIAHARFLWTTARYSNDRGDTATALTQYQHMHDYCLKQERFQDAIDATHMLALLDPDREKQIEWALAGIDAAERGGFESMLAILWNNLGWTYDELKRHDDALHALQQARIFHYKHSNRLSQLIADYAVGYALRMAGKPKEAQTAQNECLQGLRWFLAESPEDNARAVWLGQCLKELGELALAAGDRFKALAHFQEALPLLERGPIEWYAEWQQAVRDRIAELSQSSD